MVVCLNMMDEAARKGMTIDTHALEIALGVPVVEAIGARGRGIIETFRMAQEVAAAGNRPHAFVYAPDAEGVVEELAEKIAEANAIRSRSRAGSRSGVRVRISTRLMSGGTLECGGSTPLWSKPRRSRCQPTPGTSSGRRRRQAAAIQGASRSFLRGRTLFVGVLRTFPSDGRPTRPARHGGGGGASRSAAGSIATRGFPGSAASITNHQSPIANIGVPSPAIPRFAMGAERSPRKSGARSRKWRQRWSGRRRKSPCAPGSPPMRRSPRRVMRPASPSLSAWRAWPGRGPTGASKWIAWPCIPSGATRC